MKKQLIKIYSFIETHIMLIIFLLFLFLFYLTGKFYYTDLVKNITLPLKENNFQFYIIGFGLLVLIVELFKEKKNNGQKKTIHQEVIYLLTNGKHAINIGFALSFIILGLYYFIPGLSQTDRFGTSFTIFVSVMAIILGVHALYERDAPLIGTHEVLEKVIIDLERIEGGEIYIAFPGLNLGFYTEEIIKEKGIFNEDVDGKFNFPTEKDPKTKNSLVVQFYYWLRSAKVDKNVNIRTIIFSDDNNFTSLESKTLIENGTNNFLLNLYKTYYFMNTDEEFKKNGKSSEKEKLKEKIDKLYNSEDGKKVIEKCIVSNNYFNEIVKKKYSKQLTPGEFPQPLIIINDIIYFISDYGMPIYNKEFDFFEPVEPHPAELISWRRKDSALATTIKKHIDILINKT